MNELVNLGIILLSGIIVASLQLPLGTLLLLYHSSLGKNVSKKTKTLVSSFISGSLLMSFLLLATSCLLVAGLTISGTLSSPSILVLVGVLCALGIVAWFFYYKSRRTTELWLPRKVANFIDSRAKITNDNSEAFSLGSLVVLSEVIFTAPLIILSSNSILKLEPGYEVLTLAMFSLLSILPLIILRIVIRSGKNVAEIQRWRLRNKSFFRIFTGLGFFVLAGFVIMFLFFGEGF